MADDDEDYYLLAKQAFDEACPDHELYRVEDGQELMDYLELKGKYKDAVRPDVIFLDLNMPRKDGHQALREIKADPILRQIPIVILSSSKSEEDIKESYQNGAHSYIWKPFGFKQLMNMLKIFCQYWIETIELPSYR